MVLTMETSVTRRVVSNPDATTDRAAASEGLTEQRDLYQMRVALPLEAADAPAIVTRPFVPGSADESNWIRVNNQAFAAHPDQSNMTPSRLASELAAAWFDPAGFLLHESNGHLDGFCWTKQHPATADDPPMGEIYVIGVAPSAQGTGLGLALVRAGLAHLHTRGHTVGMLYVDASNTPALGLYRKLGFEVHHTDRVYERPVHRHSASSGTLDS